MIKIIDVIKHRNQYSTQTFIVTDKVPELLYERVGDYLIGEDSGFYYFYGYSRSKDAFAGREFDIPMVDGGVEKATGQWWSSIPDDYRELVGSYGTGTPEGLGKCNVFSACCVDIQLVDEWLNNNEPSNNYGKYDKNSGAFGVHTVVSRFD